MPTVRLGMRLQKFVNDSGVDHAFFIQRSSYNDQVSSIDSIGGLPHRKDDNGVRNETLKQLVVTVVGLSSNPTSKATPQVPRM